MTETEVLPAKNWSAVDASEFYDVPRWGKGYFSVGANGHVLVHPDRNPAHFIDLKELIDRLQLRGLDLPILVRFNGILKDRLRDIHDAFAHSIKEHDYKGTYACVYPIKVNQQREVVEKIIEYGKPYGFGLEAGSKPELLAVVAMTDRTTPIICNGFKDDEFIEMALLAQKIGRQVIPVVEKYTELDLILKYAEKVGVRPQIGMRVKLAARGSGRWQASGGYRSKFGLTVSELLHGLKELEQRGMADCFKLLHFHLGSQITNIRQVKAAINEAIRVYVDLHKRGAGLEYMDVGGGLGVDYDGSQTNFESSINYTLQEYANDVVYHIRRSATKPACRIRRSSRRADEPSRRITARWCSARSALPNRGTATISRPRSPRATNSRCTICRSPIRTSRPATRWRVSTMRSRRSTWRSTCSAAATSRWISACLLKTCTSTSSARSAS